MADATEVLVLRAVDEASESLAAVDTQLEETGLKAKETNDELAKTEGGSSKASSGFSKLGVAGLAAAAGVAIVGAVAIKSAINYQQSVATIAKESGTSMKAAQDVANAFLGMGGQVEASASELAGAYGPVSGELKTLYGHALNAGQAAGYMKVADDLATASGESLGTTTKALTDIMLSYHLSLGQAGQASSDLFNISRGLGVPISSLGRSLERIVPIARAAGMSMGQTGGLMLDLAKAGASGRIGMRYASQALSQLVTPSTAASKVLTELGVKLTNASGQFVGLPSAISQLKTAFATLTPAERGAAETSLFGARAAAVMGTVIQAGVGPLQQATAEAEKHGSAAQAAAVQDSTWKGQMTMLKSSVDDMMISLGQGLLPAVLAIMHPITTVISKVAQFGAKNKEVMIGILAAVGILGAFVGGMFLVRTVMNSAKTASEAFSAVQKALGPIMRAVTGAQDIQAVSTEGLTAAKEAGAAASEGLAVAQEGQTAATGEAAIAQDGLNIAMLANPVVLVVAGIALLIAGIVLLITHFKQVTAIARTVWKDVSGFFVNLWHDIVGAVGQAINWVVTHFADVANAVNTVLTDVDDFFRNTWNTIIGGVATFIGDVVNWFKRLPGEIVGAIGSIPGDIGGVLSKIPGIGGLIGGVGGLLSHLAEGGVVDRPTLALIGEAGREFVIPETVLKQASPAPGRLPSLSVPTGGGVAAGGGGASIVFDFSNAQIMSDNDINLLAQKVGSALTTLLPSQGIQIKR